MRLAALAALLLLCPLAFGDVKTITVAADGSGDFKTVPEAIAAIPDGGADSTIVHIKPGTYEGQIILAAGKSKVTFQGDDATTTFLSYSKNVREPEPNSSSPQFNGNGVVILADDFRANQITFQNISGDHGQAMALRVDGDRAQFHDCRLLGWQDTLLASSNRQYYKNCYIAGRVDFIYGGATAVFDHCEIHSRNGGHITAASTPQDHPFGFVFFNCHLTGDPVSWKATTNPVEAATAATRPAPSADLGRPWRPYASVTYINCEMDSHIKPDGWSAWRGNDNYKTARYAEYNSTGPGANPDNRLAGSKQLTKDEADAITIDSVLAGADNWKPDQD